MNVNTKITTKFAVFRLAMLLDGLMLSSVAYIFAPSAAANSMLASAGHPMSAIAAAI